MKVACSHCSHEFELSPVRAAMVECPSCGGRVSLVTDQEVQAFEQAAAEFRQGQAGRVRTPVIAGFYLLCAFLFALAAGDRSLGWAASFVLLAGMVTAGYVAVAGVMRGTYLFEQIREAVMGAGWGSWIKGALVSVAAVAFLYFVGLLGVAILLLVLSVGIAVAFHYSIDVRVAREREGAVARVREVLRGVRARGLPEEAAREVVWRHGGSGWEELYEELYGYEAKLEARQRVREAGLKNRWRRYAAWRDPVLRRLGEVLEQRRGDDIKDGDVVAPKAPAEPRREESREVNVGPRPVTEPPRVDWARVEASREQNTREARSTYRRLSYAERRWGGVMGLFVGPQARLLLGVVILLGFGLWVRQNRLVDTRRAMESATAVVSRAQVVLGDESKIDAATRPALDGVVDTGKATTPLELEGVPSGVTGLFADYRPLLAGLVLVLSAAIGSVRAGLWVVSGAVLMLTGHLLPLPELAGAGKALLGAGLGMALALVGLAAVRDRR